VAEESISGLRTVRSFAAEEREVKRYAAAVTQSFELARKRVKMGGSFMGLVSIAAYCAATVVLWYGGRQVYLQTLSPGSLTSFLIYTLMVAFSLGALSDLWGRAHEGKRRC
jgi:ABC-type multidrug transport system fused ATPase/permease subunit